jgi:hypothetical protein
MGTVSIRSLFLEVDLQYLEKESQNILMHLVYTKYKENIHVYCEVSSSLRLQRVYLQK